MICITNLDQLREDAHFKSWLQKIKDEYPSKSDEEIEKTLITFMELNNGNFPGYTPFGGESETFKQLTEVYEGNKVMAMEVYTHLFTNDFVKEFGDWCGVTNTEGFTDEQLKQHEEQNNEKLANAVLNPSGEPALFFVNSVRHLASPATSYATNKKDANLPFKIIIEDGEAKVNLGYDRPVQSGSITFIVTKHVSDAVSKDDNVMIDVEDVYKAYDFSSGNRGFSDKRLGVFLTQSSKDVYHISQRISAINGQLRINREDIHSKEEAIDFIKNNSDLIFDTDEDSPFGHIQLMKMPHGSDTAWQIISPEGIFAYKDRYKPGTYMSQKAQTRIDEMASRFFIDKNWYAAIKDYVTSNITVIKPDSYLSSPMVDYNNDRFILKPAANRTQHNVKTELALTYAVYLFNKNPDKFKKYLNWAKQFSDIRENSVGVETVKDVNMVGNLIGAIMSGQLIDVNYYTAHLYDRRAVEQAIFVSRHQQMVKSIVGELHKDMGFDIQHRRLQSLDLNKRLYDLFAQGYDKIDFSNITDNLSKNRTISKLKEDNANHSFCDTIDKAKAMYGYRRNDSGSRKMYDSTEYTKVSAIYEQLNQLNKDIKQYLMTKSDDDETVNGETLEKLINRYFTCIDTIVNIMDEDINKIEDFIWHTPEKYTAEYYQSLLYFDRSVIGMYKNSENKAIIEALFHLDSENSDPIQKALFNIFDQRQINRFDKLRDRYYSNYNKLSVKRNFNNEKGSLESIIGTMVDDSISHVVDDWCNKNLKCLTPEEEQNYRENLKLDLAGHINAGMFLDTAIGGAASSGHSIINVLYRIIQTQGSRSNLMIKQKGDALKKQFKSVFGTHNPFNQCKQFCEMVNGQTTGYFIRDVNYGLYYRAKVAEQRRLLDLLPKDSKGRPLYFTINESKSTATKLFIEWHPGSEQYQNKFLDNLDLWIEKNANRRYNAQYYIERRRILGQERNGIIVGNEAANRMNALRRQIDGIKNRYRDKETKIFLPSRVPPVQKKILDNLEQQLASLSSPYEKYVDINGNSAIRQKTGLDLAIALNIRDWNEFIQDKRNYTQDFEKYNEVEQSLRNRIGKGISQDDYDAFVDYYHRSQAKQEYYDQLEQLYSGTQGSYKKDLDDIRFKRRSILSRVKHGKKGILQQPDLNELTDSEWEELKQLDIRESGIKQKLPRLNIDPNITSHPPVVNWRTGNPFIDEHIKEGKLHTYIGADGESHQSSAYRLSVPGDKDMIEDVLTDVFSTESSEYINEQFDPTNPSYEQPKAYETDPKTGKINKKKKLYKNDKYDELKKNPKVFELYETFLNIMQEANEMFGYAAISSNYKLPQIYEREASVFVSRGCSFGNSFVYKMKRSFLIDERDLDRSYTSDIHADNTTSGKLRKRFVEMLSDPEHISTDLVYSVMAYYMTACRYSDKQDVQAQCELINRKIGSLKDDPHGNFKTQANNTVETFLFENTMNAGGTAVAIAERFMEHTTSVMLQWKLKTALKAFFDGYRLLTNVMISNKWNMRGHFWDSTNKAFRQTFTSIRSSYDMLDYNLSEALMSLNNLNFSSFQDTNKTKFTRAYYRAGLMPALTAIDHVTTKSIMLALYDSMRLYTNPDGTTKQFLNIDEFVNVYINDHIDAYKNEHQGMSDKAIKNALKKEAQDLFWGKNGAKVVTLYDAYQLGEYDSNGKIKKGTENILNIKPEYRNMFSKNEKENDDQWALLQTRIEGQLDEMSAAINGFKSADTKAGNAMRKWYLKPIFQIRSFLVSNYNELFKHSTNLKHLVPDETTQNTNDYRPENQQDATNKMAKRIDKLWSIDNNLIQFINSVTSEREMYNVLTGTKEIGYYFGVMSWVRKLVENFFIYCSSLDKHDPDFRHVTDAEKASVINMFMVIGEAVTFYNIAVYVGGLLCCLLGQGSDPDDEDEYFVHWFLWTLYDLSGSLFNEALVNLPTGDTLVDIFKNIMAVVPAMEQLKKSVLSTDDVMTFVAALLGFEDSEVFEDPEYGTETSPFNLIRSGKWQGEMYGKRRSYEFIQNVLGIPLVNLKESFSARAAKAKASYTFNNLSPIDYMKLRTPSRTDQSWERFHSYGKWSAGAALMNSLFGTEGEEAVIDFIREISRNPYSPIPSQSPVDMVERQIPLGREYE